MSTTNWDINALKSCEFTCVNQFLGMIDPWDKECPTCMKRYEDEVLLAHLELIFFS
jgi:hypothetical protein